MKVIKIGGKLIEDDSVLKCLAGRLKNYYPDCILVHGGGRLAGHLASQLGIETYMQDGRRITDQKTLEVTLMAYAGWANKKMVVALQAVGINACGLSGCDMGLVEAHKREVKEIDWGFVGDIDRVQAKYLRLLLENKIMPVLSPITFQPDGQLLNTNADSVAAAVAVAISRFYETELIFCFDKPGVMKDIEDESSVIPVITTSDYERYRKEGIIHSGMLPKLENAFKTLQAGVHSVRLTHPDALEAGTLIQIQQEKKAESSESQDE